MDIKKKPATKTEHAEAPKHHPLWIGAWFILAAAAFILYALVHSKAIFVPANWFGRLQQSLLAAGCIFMVLAAGKIIESYSTKHAHSKAAQYNFVHIIRLVTGILIAFIIVSFFFTHWYTAAVSLGLISLILGFALQTPISSFIGWMYIVFRNPYQVGDRIQLDTFKGDVVEIGYLDTTIWEFGGDYMTSDLPTGRLIRFPNSMVFSAPVYNYSWKKFPYIWNELPLHIAYESDFDFVSATLQASAKKILGNGMGQQVDHLKEIIGDTAIGKLEIKEYPFVTLRSNANTWIEVTVIYLVPPRDASAIRTAILRDAIATLKQKPDKALFPNGNNR